MASRETENNAYATFWGEKTKSIMICYGIFWRGQQLVACLPFCAVFLPLSLGLGQVTVGW